MILWPLIRPLRVLEKARLSVEKKATTGSFIYFLILRTLISLLEYLEKINQLE